MSGSLAGSSSDPRPRWSLSVVISLVVHGGLAAALLAMTPSDNAKPRRPMIELVEREPPAPKPPPALVEPKREAAEPERPQPPPRPARRPPPRRRRPPLPTAPEPPPANEPEREATAPEVFGLPDLQGESRAPTGQGVAVPRGDTMKQDPAVRKRGPRRQGFKKTYQRGESAPVAVITEKPWPAKEVVPEYPERMRALGIEGRVVLELTIDADGKVVAARVLRSLHSVLDALAKKAALAMRFRPAKVNGTPVKVKIPYSFVFQLD